MFKDSRPVPFLREWCDKILELTDGYEPIEQDYNHSIFIEGEYHPNDFTWDYLGKVYDLYPTDLDDFKNQLDAVESLPWHLDVPFIDRIVASDYQ